MQNIVILAPQRGFAIDVSPRRICKALTRFELNFARQKGVPHNVVQYSTILHEAIAKRLGNSSVVITSRRAILNMILSSIARRARG